MSRIALVRIVTLVGALICLPAHAGVEDRPWYHYQSTHFEVYSNDKPDDVSQQIKDLELFRAVALRVIGFDQNKVVSELPTKFIVFRRGADMQHVFKRSKTTGGFFWPGLHYNLMVAGGFRDSFSGQNDIVYHEYVHYLSRSLTGFANPLWYEEGLADLLSTIKSENGNMVVGTVPMERVYTLATDKAISLETVFSTNSYSDLNDNQSLRFYATSWLFVHFMNFSVNSQQMELPKKLVELVVRAQRGEPYETLFPEILGMSIKEMDEVLRKYAKGRSVLHRYPAEMFKVEGNFAQRRMDRNEVRLLLADATLTFNPRLARKFWRRAHKKDPGNARVIAGIGNTYQVDAEPEEALVYLKQALDMAPDDYLIHIDYADALLTRCSLSAESKVCDTPSVVEQVFHHFERAYELEPDLLGSNRSYGQALMGAGRYAEALERYKVALALQPSHAYLNRQVGYANLKVGNLVEARKYLQRARQWAGHSSGANPWLDDVFDELAAAEEIAGAR